MQELRRLSSRALVQRERRLGDDLAQVEGLIEKLKNDRSHWVQCDGATPPELAVYDFDAWEKDAVARFAATTGNSPPAAATVRSTLTFAEFADVKGVTAKTVRLWADGDVLPHVTDDPRNPWERDAIPVTGNRGDRRRLSWPASNEPRFPRPSGGLSPS